MSKKPMHKPPKMGPKDAKQTISKLMKYVAKYRVRFVFVFIFIILSSVASVVSSLFLKTLIDDYIEPLLIDANPVYTGLAKMIGIMALIYVVGIISSYLYNRIMVTVAQGVLKDIRDDMFSHMQTLPIKYFDTHTHGDVMSYYTNDTDTLRQMITQTIPQVFSSLVTIIAVFSSMLVISVWLTLFTVLVLAIALRCVGFIAKNSGKYFMFQQRSVADVNGYIEEMINGQKVVKVFCYEDREKQAFDKLNEELCHNATKANIFANIMMPMMNAFGYILYVLIAIVGGILAIKGVTNLSLTGFGVVTLGGIASFLNLSRNFMQPIAGVSQQFNMVVMALAGAERIFTLMSEESEVDNGYVTLVNAEYKNGELCEADHRTHLWAWKHPHSDGTVTYTELRGDITMDDVDFGYTEDKMVLHNITLFADPGQKIAFVGATGAGKTTITNLINRFYDIADGKIRYDDININKIKKQDLRRSLGIVLQDVHLFTGTVMENIRYGRLDATDEECIAAAKLANADAFIRMLPHGYNTVLSGDGSGLSQGQRQLISIARAAVNDPPVMILDEATSSIDTRTEAIVARGMDGLMEGRTVFVIAHRLSTVKNSNVIMVLEKGRIIERGSHDDLVALKGKYYQLYTGGIEYQ